MHFGATLRLLRLETGLGLRDLARRVGVSGAYLSRVESGLDPTPTPERICTIARELDVPEALLLDAAGGLSPLTVRYAEQEPQAAALFLDIARRGLSPAELAQVRRYLDTRFARESFDRDPLVPGVCELLTPRRVVLQLDADLDDAIELASVILAKEVDGLGPDELRAGLRASEDAAPSAVGASVAIPHTSSRGPLRAALITLERPQRAKTPDGLPIGTLVVLVGPRGPKLLCALAHAARLAGRELDAALRDIRSAGRAIERIAELELIR